MDWIGDDYLPSIKAETWRDVRERAAALLPDEIMVALNNYYSPLLTVLTLLDFPEAGMDSGLRDLRDYITQTRDNPYSDNLEHTRVAQDTARDRIKGYLALSGADTLLLAVARWLERRKRR